MLSSANVLYIKKCFSNFKLICFGAAMFALTNLNSQVTNVTFVFTGAMQTFIVPACATQMTIAAYGSQGANGFGGNIGIGGLGGLAQGVLAVAGGQVYNIFVGGQTGFIGGGAPGAGTVTNSSGFGGGASDVRFGGVALGSRIIVGGGGGGGGGGPQVSCVAGIGGNGGVGGNLTGGNGTTGTAGFCGPGGGFGSGGTQVAGGAAGAGNSNCGGTAGSGFPGALGIGGAGGQGTIGCGCYTGSGGAGGGGGYYGGGGGGGGEGGCGGAYSGGGGGGGSSYTGVLASPLLTAGTQAGNGRVILSYNCGVLPIELKKFTVGCSGNYALLNWSTAIEKGNNYFTIEYSLNGIEFLPVEIIKGSGNSTQEKNYNYIDKTNYKTSANIIYYRLKQTDFTGAYEYSPVIVHEKCFWAETDISVYPVPSSGEINISSTHSSFSNAEIKLFDVRGKEIPIVLNSKDKNTTTTDISNLNKGMYILQIFMDNNIINKKVVLH